MHHGLVLFAHGARDPRWAQPFEAVAQRIAERAPQLAVRLAFLELMTPDLDGAAGELVARGCTRITVLPMFLGTGGHVRRDLPRLVDALRTRWPQARFTLQPPIGEVESVMQAMAEAALAAAAGEEHDNDTEGAP